MDNFWKYGPWDTLCLCSLTSSSHWILIKKVPELQDLERFRKCCSKPSDFIPVITAFNHVWKLSHRKPGAQSASSTALSMKILNGNRHY